MGGREQGAHSNIYYLVMNCNWRHRDKVIKEKPNAHKYGHKER